MRFHPTITFLLTFAQICDIHAFYSPSHSSHSSLAFLQERCQPSHLQYNQYNMNLFSTSSSEAKEEAEKEVEASPVTKKKKKPPRDMNYNPANIMRQLENYKNIRGVGGTETINDVYVRDPKTDIFWFAGKCARCTGTVSLEDAIARQWSYIEEHACRLRIAELSRNFGTLEIWTAPGDTEMDVAYNRPHIQFQKMHKQDDYCVKTVKSTEIGFENEIYEEGEEGFRAQRTEDGKPARPEYIPPEGNPLEAMQSQNQ